MTELLQAAGSSANILPGALLLLVLLYWIVVIIGLLDVDSLDFDVEGPSGALEINSLESIAWLNSLLVFFNLGRVPFMLWLSFVALPFWAGALLVNYYLHTGESVTGFLFLIPIFIISLFISKILTAPFIKVFAAFEKEHASKTNVIGRMCTVILPATATELGQATVRTEGSPLLLHVKATTGAQISKGQTALIIDYNEKSNIYLIEPYQSN